MPSFSAITFLGALAIFMYGIRISRTGVQLLAGERLRSLIGSLTEHRFMALITGVLITMLLQSSTATIIMLVGFASSGALLLTQAMGVMLGADIGTTLVVILLSIKGIADYALLILIAGVMIEIFSRKKKTRYVSMVFLGFGFVFFGMQLMVRATSPLQGNPLLTEIFAALGQYPAYAFFGAAVFTALVQNSATTLGLTIACAFSGILGIHDAIPMVLGANVGGCVPALLYSIGGKASARRVAFAHFFLKSFGALVAMGLLPYFTDLIEILSKQLIPSGTTPAPQIALAHMTFNVCLSLFFLPWIRQGAWFIEKLVPEPNRPEDKPFGHQYLDPRSLETPALAFSNARREIFRMAEIAQEMLASTIAVFENDDRELMRSIEEQDDKVDLLDKEIKFYLAKISQEGLNPDQARMQLNLLTITCGLEEIGDIITKNVLELAEKKILKARHFSEEGWKEIVDIHAKVLENFQLMVSTLAMEDKTIVRKAARHEHHLALLEDKYREAHLQRLHKGLKETIETSSIHLDLLANFRRINTKLTDIVTAATRGINGAE